MELKAELTTKNIRKSKFAPTVTFASNEDGEDIETLVIQNGFTVEADWSEVPNWLVAKLDNEIVGCLQVLPGKPFVLNGVFLLRGELRSPHL